MPDVATALRILEPYIPDNLPWQAVGGRWVRHQDLIDAVAALKENPRVRRYQ